MKKLKNMNVRSRLMTSFMGVVILASIAGLLGVILLLVADSRYSTALELNGFIQGDIGQYTSYLNESGAYVRDILYQTDADSIKSAQEKLAVCDEKVEYYYAEFAGKLENDEERALLAIIDETYPKYIEARDQLIELGIQGKKAEAGEIANTTAIPLQQTIIDAADELMQMNVKMGDDVSDTLSASTIIMVIVIVAVIIAAVVISSVFANVTAKDFDDQIVKVQKATEKLANGDLSVHVKIDCKNEIGEMAEHFNDAVEKLRLYVETIEYGLSEVANGNFAVQPPIEFHGDFVALKDSIVHITTTLSSTMRQINEGSEQVALGAEQMAESAQTLAEGATSQAGAVQELTATIESVAIAAENSAKKAEAAYQDAEGFAKVAEQGSREMELLTEAMERITSTSKEIESIIGEIEDIASQTNLLSLNASIEAARAGEAGRGFAVVADQIGKLASDSAQSAVNTKELIAKSLDEIVKGNEITNRTAEALKKVIDGINQLAGASKETSTLSAEQAETMVQVQQGIEQIADVVQNNSASAEETSATSEELSAQSQNLKALVDQFILLE